MLSLLLNISTQSNEFCGDITGACCYKPPGTPLPLPTTTTTFPHAQDTLRIALEKNKRLAHEYDDLRKRLVEARQEVVSALSQRNQARQSFHRYTQVILSACLVFITFTPLCPGFFFHFIF